MHKSAHLLFILLIGILACTSSENILSFNLPPTPVATSTETFTPSLTAVPASPTPTLKVEATPTNTALPAVPTPEIDSIDLSPYQQAMLPDFMSDVETVAATDASRYYLEITLNFDGDEPLQLKGVERVQYTNTENVTLSEVYFRLYPNLPGYGGQMDVETVVVNNQLVSPTLEADDSALRIPLPTPLSPGAMADISLIYQAAVPSQPRQGFNIFSYSHNTAALAGFYPAMAVFDDEGWNTKIPPPYGDATYLDISLYQIWLTVPQEMVVAGSGSVLNSVSNNNNTKTLWLASGPMRDFYLVMRADYQVVSEVVDGTVVNSYYPPNLEEGGQLALRYAADSLRVFNKYFGQYPYAEFDIVATPTTAGGVEYPGIVVVAEQLYNRPGGFFQHATSHEVAHQWWYGLVGNDQVDEPWLDESLTNYSAIIYWEEVEGAESANNILENLFFGPYEQAKRQGRDRAVLGPVSDFTPAEYSTFVYGKGPLFFNALRQAVGDDTFFEIMQTYYLEHKYKIAQAEDLLTTIETVSGRNVEPLLETWLQGR